CTIEMLYLVDDGKSFGVLEDLNGYNGKITSCMKILGTIHGKASKKAKTLMKTMDEDLAHKCVMIHMGIEGTIDYNYLDKYPECKGLITQVGNIVREYYEDVDNVRKLHELLRDVDNMPEYTMESCTMVAELSTMIDPHKLFERIQEPFEILMEVSHKGIRRRISKAFPPRRIDRKYTKPTIAIRPKYVIIKKDGKDYTFMDKAITVQRKGDEAVDMDIPLGVIHDAGYKDVAIEEVYDTNIRLQFPHDCIWHRRVMAYIVSNHEPFKDVMKVDTDVSYTAPYLKQEREMLPTTVLPTGAKCSIRNRYVVISNASNEFAVVCTIAIIDSLLEVYRKVCNGVYKALSGSSRIPTKGPKKQRVYSRTKIEDLRERLPELFTSNYTRECHRLPIMLEKKDIKTYEDMGRIVIKYPKSGSYSRWYTSPSDDLHVGLKVNRLANKDKFKYIVVCYTSNHLLNPSKRTYQYYFNEDQTRETRYKDEIKTLKALGDGRKGPIPHMMEAEYGVQGYKRLGAGGSFEQCLDIAMGASNTSRAVKRNPDLLLLLMQDTTHPSMTSKWTTLLHDVDGALFYRLFEEVYRCNIVVIQVDHRGKYRLCIPRNGYVWEPCKYPGYVVILKNVRKLYHDTSTTYELIVHEDTCVFSRDDDLVSKLIRVKSQSTVKPYYNGKIRGKDIVGQHVDDEGRCVLVYLKDGSIKDALVFKSSDGKTTRVTAKV
ncbi:hypothetical protein BGZ82_000668, partial [Podila clonocystis]